VICCHISFGAGLPDNDLGFVFLFFTLGSSGGGLSDPELEPEPEPEAEGLLFGGILDDV
jgi:hypothetical protein